MGEMLQLRAWLIGSKPEIWRRLIVHPRLTLEQLHTVLQYSFGWMNCHLHQFKEKDGTRYAIPFPDEPFDRPPIDERKALLADVFDRERKIITYEYDFGDSWLHAIEFEKRVDSETVEYPFESFVQKGRGVFSGKERAAVCIAGERNGPPEDCGGIYAVQELLKLKRHPPLPTARKDADARERLEWLGDWDPDRVDLAEINPLIGRVRVKKKHMQA